MLRHCFHCTLYFHVLKIKTQINAVDTTYLFIYNMKPQTIEKLLVLYSILLHFKTVSATFTNNLVR